MGAKPRIFLSRFITPVAPQPIEEKIDNGPTGTSGGPSYSEISPSIDMDTVTYAALGAGAIGTVLYGIYAANANDKKRRSDVYKRSLDDERKRAADQLWTALSQHIFNGKTNIFRSYTGPNVINKWFATLCWIKVLWLVVASRETSFTQSESFISSWRSNATNFLFHRLQFSHLKWLFLLPFGKLTFNLHLMDMFNFKIWVEHCSQQLKLKAGAPV